MGGKRSACCSTRVRVGIRAPIPSKHYVSVLSSMHSSASIHAKSSRPATTTLCYFTYRPSWKSKFKNPASDAGAKNSKCLQISRCALLYPSPFSEDHRRENSIMGARRRVSEFLQREIQFTIHDTPRFDGPFHCEPRLSPIKACRNLEESRNEYTLDVVPVPRSHEVAKTATS